MSELTEDPNVSLREYIFNRRKEYMHYVQTFQQPPLPFDIESVKLDWVRNLPVEYKIFYGHVQCSTASNPIFIWSDATDDWVESKRCNEHQSQENDCDCVAIYKSKWLFKSQVGSAQKFCYQKCVCNVPVNSLHTKTSNGDPSNNIYILPNALIKKYIDEECERINFTTQIYSTPLRARKKKVDTLSSEKNDKQQ